MYEHDGFLRDQDYAQRGITRTFHISLKKENPKSPSRGSLKAFAFPVSVQDRLLVAHTIKPKLYQTRVVLTASEEVHRVGSTASEEMHFQLHWMHFQLHWNSPITLLLSLASPMDLARELRWR